MIWKLFAVPIFDVLNGSFDVLNGYADRGQKGTSYYMPELYIDLSTN